MADIVNLLDINNYLSNDDEKSIQTFFYGNNTGNNGYINQIKSNSMLNSYFNLDKMKFDNNQKALEYFKEKNDLLLQGFSNLSGFDTGSITAIKFNSNDNSINFNVKVTTPNASNQLSTTEYTYKIIGANFDKIVNHNPNVFLQNHEYLFNVKNIEQTQSYFKDLGFNDFISQNGTTITINFNNLTSSMAKTTFVVSSEIFKSAKASNSLLGRVFDYDSNDETYVKDENLTREALSKTEFGRYVISQNKNKFKKEGDTLLITKKQLHQLSIDFVKQEATLAEKVLNSSKNTIISLDVATACGNNPTIECVKNTAGYKSIEKVIAEVHGIDVKDVSYDQVVNTANLMAIKSCHNNPKSSACQQNLRALMQLGSVHKETLSEKIIPIYNGVLEALRVYSTFRDIHNNSEKVKAYNRRTSMMKDEQDKARKIAVANAMRKRKALNL